VGGFRFDAITTLFEDPKLTDEDVLKDKDGKSDLNAYGDPQLNDTRRPTTCRGVHPVMQEMRAWSDTFNSPSFPARACSSARPTCPTSASWPSSTALRTSRSFTCPWTRRSASSTSWTWPSSAPSLIDVETGDQRQHSAAGV
jgi:hypothetical protein